MISEAWFEHYRALAASDLPRRWIRFFDDENGEWLEELVLTESEWWAIRQVNPLENLEKRPRYDVTHPEDEHGGLADQPLPVDVDGTTPFEPRVEEVSQELFEAAWNNARYL